MPTDMIYRHTQIGTIILVSIGVPVVVLLWIAFSVGLPTIAIAVLVLLVVLMVLFGSLTVEVAPATLRIWFGPGLIRKTFALAEVNSVRAVRNRWYHGWGIRYTGQGWLYNVSGLDAIELELRDGHRVRIGTDQPAELERALHAAGAGRGGK